jgi:DNA modification methylase
VIPADLAPLIHQGDALELARKMPDESVQVIVTSPPYWRMRDYGVAGQWGLEDTVEEFVDRLVGLFHELRRVLRKDGTCWINIGDTYVGGGRSGAGPSTFGNGGDRAKETPEPKPTGTLKRKDLALTPFRLALGLQEEGWWVREAIIWAKPNGIPEPARGRPVHAHEYILLLARSDRYFYDGFAVRQPIAPGTLKNVGYSGPPFVGAGTALETSAAMHEGGYTEWRSKHPYRPSDGGANLRSVWTIAMEPFGGDHFAPYPSEIPRRAILAGSSARGACAKCGAPWERRVALEGGLIGMDWFPDKGLERGRVQGLSTMRERGMEDGGLVAGRSRDPVTPPGYHQRDIGFEPGCECGADVVPCVVLDPFSGSGTTLQVARELGRRSVGFELNPAYHEISEMRPGIGMPDILSWSAPSETGMVAPGESPALTARLRPPERSESAPTGEGFPAETAGGQTVTPRPRSVSITLDEWE